MISSNVNIPSKNVCLVAIIRDELPFLEEWIAYHMLIGVQHFYLYDDDPMLPLSAFLEPYNDRVTVIEWFEKHHDLPGRNRQTKAYEHALNHFARAFEWTGFVDIDEFIVLRNNNNIHEFLNEFKEFEAVSLNWHVFGHNGFFDNPVGLITSELTRRKFVPSLNVKTITRTSAIKMVTSAHFCRMSQNSRRCDPNGIPFEDSLYAEKTKNAHINHYQCRSFSNWMQRVRRGDVTVEEEAHTEIKDLWRVDELQCLKQFVTTVALDKNEYVDDFMKKFQYQIVEEICRIRQKI